MAKKNLWGRSFLYFWGSTCTTFVKITCSRYVLYTLFHMRKKTYALKEFNIEIELEEPQSRKFVLEFDIDFPVNRITGVKPKLTALITEEDFDYEMSVLVPKTIGTNYIDECISCLMNRITIHYKRFGRLLPPDLEQYIAETILIMRSISRKIPDPAFDNDRENMFKMLLIGISNKFGIPVEINFA